MQNDVYQTYRWECYCNAMFGDKRSRRSKMDSSTMEPILGDPLRLSNTEVGEVVVRTSKAVVLDKHSACPPLGRFVLEKEGVLMAGGIVTETTA